MQNAPKKPFIAPNSRKAYLSLLRTGMATKSGDELDLRHFHCSREHVSACSQGRPLPQELHLRHQNDLHQGASTTLSKYCNCGTVAVLSTLDHPGICRCTQRACERHVQPQRLQLWDLDQFLTTCNRKMLDLHNRDIEHLINGLQMGNLSGLLNWTTGNDLCATTGKSTTLTCTTTGMSITSPEMHCLTLCVPVSVA